MIQSEKSEVPLRSKIRSASIYIVKISYRKNLFIARKTYCNFGS